MSQRLILAVSTALIVGSWAICALIYAKYGGGGYNGQEFVALIFVAAGTTIWALIRVVRGWLKQNLRLTATFMVSVLAAAAVLALALAIHGRG